VTQSGRQTSPLDGLRVLDLTQALAGPYCTMILGDLGADVIKVEAPGRGDDTRLWGPPFVNGESTYFLSINRNKRSVALNLKSEGGLQAALDLLSRCDVLVENFRPGTATRLGLGAERLRQRLPRLVYCSISGFGQEGPPRAGYDQIVQGTAGLMSMTGFPDGLPVKVGVPISDIVAGMFAAHGVLAALLERERTGEGRSIDVAMQDSAIALLTFQASRFFSTGQNPSREGNHHPTIAPYGTFETANGYINICVGNDGQWQRFCAAVDAVDLATDNDFATNADRLAQRSSLHARLEPLLKRRSTAEWLKRLEAAGVPAGAIRSLDEVFSDADVLARELRVDFDHPTAGQISVAGAPWKFDEDSAVMRVPPPVLGQDTKGVLNEVAGYAEEDIETLARRGDVQLSEADLKLKT
jgi:crotonobetainyl-CoA:carnitine CoA-transferase CaiB-like acyl-CoA transferase